MIYQNKKKILLIVVLLITISIPIIFYFYTFKEEKKPPSEVPSQSVSYKNVTPGKTSVDELTQALGEPEDTKVVDDDAIMHYESTSPVRQHEIVATKDRVEFVKEIVSINDKTNAKDLIAQHGIAKHLLYDNQNPTSSFVLYVYPEIGLAYLGHPVDGGLLEIWYFPPTDINDFIEKWAPTYSSTKPEPIQ